MAQHTITLTKGITIGDVTHCVAVLREASALDVIEAAAESEKVVMVSQGLDRHGLPVLVPQLVASPTITGMNVLRRQIVKIGDIAGPIDDAYFSKLSPEDLNALQDAADTLQHAALEVAQRGRSDSAGGAAE